MGAAFSNEAIRPSSVLELWMLPERSSADRQGRRAAAFYSTNHESLVETSVAENSGRQSRFWLVAKQVPELRRVGRTAWTSDVGTEFFVRSWPLRAGPRCVAPTSG